MRPVIATDLLCAGRAVLFVAPEARSHMARTLVRNACLADRHRTNNGARHAQFGDGTLAAAARGAGMIAEPGCFTRDFAAALVLVLRVLIENGFDD